MKDGITKLGIALTVIFVLTLLALLVQLFHSLRRRRFFHHRRRVIADGVGADHLVLHTSSDSTFSSKVLLYFFCIRVRPHSQIQPSSITGSREAVDDLNSDQQLDMERIDVDVFKLQGMLGPPRFLFTIKEEEKEDLESPAEKSLHSAKKVGNVSRNSARNLEESLKAADGDAAAVVVGIDKSIDATPFSTPCASPTYFTPMASPVHEND